MFQLFRTLDLIR